MNSSGPGVKPQMNKPAMITADVGEPGTPRAIIGAYSLNTSMTDVFITVIFGLVGYWLRKTKYPLAPLVVAIVTSGRATI